MALSSSNPSIYGFYDLDNIDQQIIVFLQKNGRESFAKIADEIGIPPSTVRDRTHRMMESGVLKIVALVNTDKATNEVKASLGVKLAWGDHRAVATDIAALSEVTEAAVGVGRFDILVNVRCRDNHHLLQVVSQIQSYAQVQQVETFVYFSVIKESNQPEF